MVLFLLGTYFTATILRLDTTLSCDNKSIVYAPISRLRRSFVGIRKMPTSKAIKKETCKQACSLFFLSPWLALYSLLSRILLDDCSNTSWSYSTSTFTFVRFLKSHYFLWFSCPYCPVLWIFQAVFLFFSFFSIKIVSQNK